MEFFPRAAVPLPSPGRRGGRPAAQRAGEAGYSLVVLIVAVTVLNVMVAAMLPLWSTAIKREKEEELIFRGFQYAEAIRVYRQNHQGAYPTKLEDLIKANPRCIRQLWKDPMTKDGKWQLIFQNQPPPQPKVRDRGENGGNGEDPGDDNGRPQFGPKEGDVVEVGPIIGVRSKSGEKSMLVFDGKERYDEWQFTETLFFSGGAQAPPGGGPGAPIVGGIKLSLRWEGRPQRFVNQTPGAQLQDGSLPGEDPKKRTRGKGRNLP